MHGAAISHGARIGYAALQAIEPISQRTAAWQAFARCAVPQLGLGSLARLVALLQQYGPDEDAELALLL